MNVHTPGPWEVADLDTFNSYRIRHAGRYGEAIVALVPPAEGWSLAHQDANAAIIAAAPELLEALYAALPLAEDAAMFLKDDFKPGYLAGIVRAMKSAIAKAEGR